MAEEDLTLRMRTKGAQSSKRDVDTTARSVTGLGRATEKTTRHAGMFSRATSGMLAPVRHLRGEVGHLAKSFIGMGLAFGSVEGLHRSIETTDELVKTTVQLRNQFGLTTEAASGLAGVMQARNLAPQGLRMGLITLSKQMQAVAAGNDKAATAFNYIGISAGEVTDALASPDGLEHIFERVTGALTRMPGGANKAAYGQVLLGRATKSLAPLLQEGALGLEQQLKWAKEYGVTLDGHTVGSVEEMAAAQTKAQYAALGLQIQLGQFLAPALTTVNETFSDVIASFRDGRPEGNQFAQTIYTVGQDLKPLGHALEDVGGFLKDHPALLEASAIAWLGWKTGILKLITFPATAYARGLITGRAFATGFASASSEGAGAAAIARGGAAAGPIWARAFAPAAGLLAASILGYTIYKHRKEIARWTKSAVNAAADNAVRTWNDPLGGVQYRTVDAAKFNKSVGIGMHAPGSALLPYGHYQSFPGTSATSRGGKGRSSADEALRTIARRFTPAELQTYLSPRIGLGGQAGHQREIVEAVLRAMGHVVIENHNTITMDGKVVATGVHRAAVKAKAVK